MQSDNTPRKLTHTAAIERIRAFNSGEKFAFSPAEFASGCGHHKCWAYRQIYRGRVRVIRDAGRLLIPIGEVQKFLTDTVLHGSEPIRGDSSKMKTPSRRKGDSEIPTSEGGV